MIEDEPRIARLEQWLRRLLVITTLLLAFVVCLGVIILREDRHPNVLTFAGDPPTTLGATGLAVGSAVLDEQGLSLSTEVSPLTHSQIVLRARDDAAYLAFGIGPIGIAESVKKGTSIVEWRANGVVDSKVKVDTDTGAWTLVRTRHDSNYKVVKEETQVLLPPLGP